MQKYDALVSKHSLWNYHAFFTIMKFNKKLFEEYLDRKVTIFDEAHKIEDQIIQFVGFDIFSGQVDECNLNLEKYNFTDLDSMIQLTDDMTYSYAKKIKDIKESSAFQNDPDYELITGLERRHDRSAQAKIDIMADKDNFIVNNPIKDLNGNFRTVSVNLLMFQNLQTLFLKLNIKFLCLQQLTNPVFVKIWDCEKMMLHLLIR